MTLQIKFNRESRVYLFYQHFFGENENDRKNYVFLTLRRIKSK